MKTPISVSEATLQTVYQLMDNGKLKTGQQIARKIKRDYTTVYRALKVLQGQGRVTARKRGRFKFFSQVGQKTKAKTQPPKREHATVQQIQTKVAELLTKGPARLTDMVQSMPYPRSSTYAAVAEMRRQGLARLHPNGLLEPIQPLLTDPTLVAGEPAPIVEMTQPEMPQLPKTDPEADAPVHTPAAADLLADLVRELAEFNAKISAVVLQKQNGGIQKQLQL